MLVVVWRAIFSIFSVISDIELYFTLYLSIWAKVQAALHIEKIERSRMTSVPQHFVVLLEIRNHAAPDATSRLGHRVG